MDDDLKLPPFLSSLYFGLAPGSPLCTVCISCLIRGVGARPSPQLLHQVSFAVFLNEKPVWTEVGLNTLQHNCKEYREHIVTQYQRAYLASNHSSVLFKNVSSLEIEKSSFTLG